MSTLHVDDFIVLGRTVPEDSKRYGQRICMAGFSPDLNQLLRVYPLMVPWGETVGTNGFKARHQYALDLRRNEHDNRMESWRLQDEKKPTSTAWEKAHEVKKAQLLKWLLPKAVPSTDALNQCRLSLGVMRLSANAWKGFMVSRRDVPEQERGLFDDLGGQEIDASAVKHAPYIHFEDGVGPHKLQVREWGAYQLLSQPKYAANPDALWGAAGYRTGRELLVVLGNMCNHRTNWLVIKTFEIDEPKSGPGLFDNTPNE